MPSTYKYLSGAAKRKLQKDRERKLLINKQKITQFFKEAISPESEAQKSEEVASYGIKQQQSETNNNFNDDHLNKCNPEQVRQENNEQIDKQFNIKQSEDEISCEENQSKNINSVATTSSENILHKGNIQHDNKEKSNKSADSEDLDKNTYKFENMQNLTDPAFWPEIINDKIRNKIIELYPPKFEEFKKKADQFTKDIKNRRFSKHFLYSKSKNGRENFPREWLIWSSTQQSLHCYPCLLFSDPGNQKSILANRIGFQPTNSPWKKLYDRLPKHEESNVHKNYFIKWKTLQQTLKGRGSVDISLQKHLMNEVDNWKAILRRLLDVTLFLASRGLPFRGNSSIIGEVDNGNFLGILELLGKYDEVTRNHLNKVKQQQVEGKGKGLSHYLSWLSQNEFISSCGDHVLKTILNERREAIYFSLIVDATPDVSHEEQNVLIVRYLSFNKDREFEIKERFLEFLNFNKKTGEEIFAHLIESLNGHAIPLEDCRGQGYDNASNMSGKVRGVKSRILRENELALFSPCAAHSLNLVGINAAKQGPQIMTFFGCIQRLYVLFSGSPERWHLLKEEVECSLTYVSETRWSSRIEAVRPIIKSLPGILKALDRMVCEITNVTEKVYSEAVSLRKYFSSFETVIMASVWFKILSSIDDINKIIQARGISLEVEVKLIDDLKTGLLNMREKWSDILKEATTVAETIGINPHFTTDKRPKKRKRFFDEETKEEFDSIKADESFKIHIFYTVLDCIISDLDHRFQASKYICDLFKPILKYMSLERRELEKSAKTLSEFYTKDISPSFINELQHLRKIHNTVLNSEFELNPKELLNMLYRLNLEQIFKNVCIAIRIFLTLPVSVSEAERAFSKLANQLKTWQRSSISQARLNSLAILSIEHQLANNLNFDAVINDFAILKARKFNK